MTGNVISWVIFAAVILGVLWIFYDRDRKVYNGQANLLDTLLGPPDAEGWRKRLAKRGYTQHWFECMWYRRGKRATFVACEAPGGVLISLTGWRCTPGSMLYVPGWYIDHSCANMPGLLPMACSAGGAG